MGKELYTRWGKHIDPEHVLQEYPRPGLRRQSCINLNGYWQYAITKSGDIPEKYDGKILVPFSPEALLSGVGRQLKPDEYLHYEREVQIEKPGEKTRLLLHFGAVDQSCRVWLNGREAGRHEGGYLPFTLDITNLVQEGSNRLQVAVQDLSDTSYHAKGKQSLERGGMWYTAQSGIWQTVWMEEVPETFITRLKLTPDLDRGCIRVKVFTNAASRKNKTEASKADSTGLPVHAVISFKGEVVKKCVFQSDRTACIPLRDIRSWSPEKPDLYEIRLQMQEDTVDSYFAMRKFSVEWDENGILRFFLNGRPYYHNGLLDQGYYPDGLYTAPSDEAMIFDIQTMKDMGFNMLRKHIKIEPERWYYHCDRLGMLVWQDMVCGGEPYVSWFVTYMPNILPFTCRTIRDRWAGLFSRRNSAGKLEYIRELKETILHLYNHPSVAAWVPFNEGWGQFDAARISAMVRRMDPSRSVDEASGWFDQGGGDMYSIHNYFRKLRVRPRRNRVIALTECGGYSYRDPDHSWCSEVYGYRKYYSEEELMQGIAGLWEKELIPNIKKGLGASVYTQVSDIEDEVNGLLTYDREKIKVSETTMQEINRELEDAFEKAVCKRDQAFFRL